MDDDKCIVPSRHGVTLNSRGAASPLVRLEEGEEVYEAPDHHQGVLSQDWGGTEPNRTVTFVMLKDTANDRRKNIFHATMNFVGLDLMLLSIRCHKQQYTPQHMRTTNMRSKFYPDISVIP
ncbi:uncharacterized protein TNCV_659071 [Trichonephila clavipes]|nr:uncharacterized protein TNCV_659071 [Trichonephila clavipes]